ncbi:MAG: elongation factor Ts [SAR202 cluster bacterium]|nr:elongation factor Ts [SAR202 cluster bacterium]MQG68177.1 elongation factor Ts [SAR202 cluster bacterium]HAL49146.1 elongation factor Ts [Dehalococcoidia bacterium]
METIKALRDLTSAGIMDCKNALEESSGDIAKAEEILRSKGIASALKKSSRETNQGLVESYIHSGGRIGAIVEANCETDFVARTDDFKSLAHNLAMQVAAMNPKYVDASDIPEGDDENAEEVCLLQQPFIKDPSLSVQDLVREAAGKLGENVQVRRFTRFALGE